MVQLFSSRETGIDIPFVRKVCTAPTRMEVIVMMGTVLEMDLPVLMER